MNNPDIHRIKGQGIDGFRNAPVMMKHFSSTRIVGGEKWGDDAQNRGDRRCAKTDLAADSRREPPFYTGRPDCSMTSVKAFHVHH